MRMAWQTIRTRQVRMRVSNKMLMEIMGMRKGHTSYVVTHKEYHQKRFKPYEIAQNFHSITFSGTKVSNYSEIAVPMHIFFNFPLVNLKFIFSFAAT